METSPKMFWLVLLFNAALAVNAYRQGYNLLAIAICFALAYIVPRYIRSFFKQKPKNGNWGAWGMDIRAEKIENISYTTVAVYMLAHIDGYSQESFLSDFCELMRGGDRLLRGSSIQIDHDLYATRVDDSKGLVFWKWHKDEQRAEVIALGRKMRHSGVEVDELIRKFEEDFHDRYVLNRYPPYQWWGGAHRPYLDIL